MAVKPSNSGDFEIVKKFITTPKQSSC